MKSTELKEFKKKDEKELKRLLAENREKLRELRFSVNANQLKDVKSLNKIKKIVARILTILRERQK